MAYFTAGLLAAGTGLVGIGPAQAAPGDVSEAQGKFLGGQAAGIDLDDIAEVSGALAENPSGENPVVANPLSAEVLNAVSVDLGDGLQLFGSNGLIQLGAVNQYGEAQDNGDARAAAGAVSDQGGIGVGNAADFPANASVNLAPLLNGLEADGLLSELSLELGALSSSAEQLDTADVVTSYQIAGADLNLTSPVLGGIYADLQSSITGLQGTLDGFEDLLESGVGSGLNLGTLANVDVDATVDTVDLEALLPDGPIGAEGVTIDLTTGSVSVDLEAFIAADENLPNINDLGPNAELLNGAVLNALTQSIAISVSAVLSDVVDGVQAAINNASVNLDVDIQVLGETAGINVGLVATVAEIADGNGELTVNTSGAAGLLQPILNALGVSDPEGVGSEVLSIVGGLLGETFELLGNLDSLADEIATTPLTETLTPVLVLVNQVASVTLNVQPETGDLGPGTSTVRAAQVTLLPGAPLAQVNLASSTVRGTAVIFETAISADPSSVEQGAPTDITGEGFAPGETVSVSLPGEEPVVVTAADDGTFTVSLPIPEGYDLGAVDVTAVGEVSETPATTEITVTEPDGDADADVDADGAADPDADANVDASASASASADADASADPAAQAAAESAATADADSAESADASAAADASADPAAQAAAEAAADEDASTAASADADSASEAAAEAAAESDGVSDSEADASAAAEADASAAASAAANADASSDASAAAAGDADATATEETDADADVDADGAADPDADANVDASASASASADADASADPAAQAAAESAATADADSAESADASAAADASADPAAQAAAEAAADEDASTAASADADSASEAAAEAAAESDGVSDSEADASAAAEADASAAASAAANADASSDASAAAAGDADATATEDADADVDADGDEVVFDPSVTLDPESVQAGEEVVISGDDFVPDSTVTVVVTDADGNVVDTVEGVEVSADGQFEVSWTVPEGVDPGELMVTATDDSDGDVSGSATLTITDGVTAAGEATDDDELATTGSGTALFIGGLSALLLMIGLAVLLILRHRRLSTIE